MSLPAAISPEAEVATSSRDVPVSCTVTPELLKVHNITDEEYAKILAAMGRTPSLTELGVYSVMWSEHCSYKSSRVHLKRLPTKGFRESGPGSVMQGPGENAGIIDVGDGWACAFKIESHNHPSYIEPYQGAATGVGGILRDIFTMGARPMAVMDSLRFGPVSLDAQSGIPRLDADDEQPGLGVIDYEKNRSIMEGVVHGVAGYGNCFGVPNLGGETRFEPCYSGNPLLNAFALGLVRHDEVFYAKATGVSNPVIYVGAKTGRDGIHGATMASEEFTEGSEQKRPNVQMGDPFMEKLLLEACLEAMKTGAVAGIQDMGAAGLTCSTCEMGARGGVGLEIELDRVPQRDSGMSSYEIMLSESQERMLLVAHAGREREVLDVFEKWGLDAAVVGTVIPENRMKVRHGGVLVADLSNESLTDDAPVYHRPVGEWKAPVPLDPPAWVLEELKKPRDYTADLKKLLASPNICSKRHIYEQYDSMVQTNTVFGPGQAEAGVIRIKGTGNQGIANREQQTGNSKQGTANREQQTASVTAISSSLTPFGLSSRSEAEGSAFLSSARMQDQAGAPPSPKAKVGSEASDTENVDPPHIASNVWDRSAANSEGKNLSEGTGFSPSITAHKENGASAPEGKPERGLAMALAGNGRWCYLDPKLGAMHAVAEAARKVACTGATPVAATNCLNFGNPMKPEIMAQLSEAIDGIAEACTALGTPITGGNVSLYNETKGEGIYPTPVIGVVGILDDVNKAVPSGFQSSGQKVIIVFSALKSEGLDWPNEWRSFGSSAFAQTVLGISWGQPPILYIEVEAKLHKLLQQLSIRSLITSASDVSDGGLAVALARASIVKNIGLKIERTGSWPNDRIALFFADYPSMVVLTCNDDDVAEITSLVEATDAFYCEEIGKTGGDFIEISFNGEQLINAPVEELLSSFSSALEEQVESEVVLA